MLTRFQRRKLIDLFSRLDATGDGFIEFVDFIAQADRLRGAAGWQEAHPLYGRVVQGRRRLWAEFQKRMDADNDGQISLDEWISFFERVDQQAHLEGRPPDWLEALSKAFFHSLDLDGDGRIGPEDYRLYLLSIRPESSPKELFGPVDVNRDGFVSLAEFDRAFVQWIFNRDPQEPGNYFLTGGPPA